MAQELSGKVCLVTGATLGIGRETTLGLAGLGATVVLVGRDAARTQETVDQIRRETSNPNVDAFVFDLSLQSGVRALAAAFMAKYARLDVLVNNAGAVFTQREVTAEGVERTWALNHLAPFLLTNLLLDRLKASAASRVVTVASNAHESGAINFDDLQGAKGYAGFRAYSQSKLANIMFTYALARRLARTGVTANCLHPGVVATGFGHNTRGIISTLLTIGRPFLLTAAKGAKTSIYLASSPEVAGLSGKYFAKCKPVASSARSEDVAVQERLWAVSAEETGLASA